VTLTSLPKVNTLNTTNRGCWEMENRENNRSNLTAVLDVIL
jgi:hypothetical protein